MAMPSAVGDHPARQRMLREPIGGVERLSRDGMSLELQRRVSRAPAPAPVIDQGRRRRHDGGRLATQLTAVAVLMGVVIAVGIIVTIGDANQSVSISTPAEKGITELTVDPPAPDGSTVTGGAPAAPTMMVTATAINLMTSLPPDRADLVPSPWYLPVVRTATPVVILPDDRPVTLVLGDSAPDPQSNPRLLPTADPLRPGTYTIASSPVPVPAVPEAPFVASPPTGSGDSAQGGTSVDPTPTLTPTQPAPTEAVPTSPDPTPPVPTTPDPTAPAEPEPADPATPLPTTPDPGTDAPPVTDTPPVNG